MRTRATVLLSSGRKGTFLVLTALEQHPQVQTYQQLLSRPDYYPRETGEEILTRLFDDCDPSVEAVVLPVSWLNARDRYPGFWKSLTDRKVRVVHLKRRNMLRWYVSLRIAQRTGIWSTNREPDYAIPTIHVDSKECVECIRADRQAERAADDFFAHHAVLHLVYEDVVQAFDRHMAQLQRFLGVAPLILRPRTVKQESRPLCDVIDNFAELREAFSGTEWETLLEAGTEPAASVGMQGSP